MPDAQTVRRMVQAVDRARDTLTKADFDLSAGAPGTRERIASAKVNRPHAIRSGVPVDMGIMALQTYTADGGAPETFNLSHDLVESGATDRDVIVYVDGTRTEPASVDYDANTVDVATTADDDVGIYFASGTQALVEVVKTAPNGVDETLWTGDIGLWHMRDHGKEPVEFSLNRHYWEPFVPTDWTLDIYVRAPYTARWSKDINGDGNQEEAINSLIGIPVNQASEEIPGLSRYTRLAAAES
jgi:hypothetical protein